MTRPDERAGLARHLEHLALSAPQAQRILDAGWRESSDRFAADAADLPLPLARALAPQRQSVARLEASAGYSLGMRREVGYRFGVALLGTPISAHVATLHGQYLKSNLRLTIVVEPFRKP